MQGLAATTNCGSLTFLAPRIQSPYLKKHLKPTRVRFSNFGPLPNLRLSVSSSSQRQIVPLIANAPVDFASSNQLFAHHGLPPLALGSRRNLRPIKPVTVNAYYKDWNLSRFKPPKTEERPEWFWMILACVPYLISLKMSEIGFYMKPFLEQHGGAIGKTIINLIPGAANQVQRKYFLVYSVVGFACMANKNLPRYFRFNLTMGMLLQTAMEIIWLTSDFFPLINGNGRLAMYYEMVMWFSYLCLLFECLRCAMTGVYPQISIFTDAAFIKSQA